MKKLSLIILSTIIMTNIQAFDEPDMPTLDKDFMSAVLNRRNNCSVIADFIKRGANVNACSQIFLRSVTPVLRCALDRGTDKESVEIIKLLIAAGANVNARTYNRVDNEHYGMMPLLTYAVIYSSPEVVQLFINAGANKKNVCGDTSMDYKKTALMAAQELGKTEIVKILSK